MVPEFLFWLLLADLLALLLVIESERRGAFSVVGELAVEVEAERMVWERDRPVRIRSKMELSKVGLRERKLRGEKPAVEGVVAAEQALE
jgi:hypothetical protein